MKKTKSENEPRRKKTSTDVPQDTSSPIPGEDARNSIQEFIDIRKLQNRVLKKMIENINQNDKKDKSKNKQK
jgi:hypothetical protein